MENYSEHWMANKFTTQGVLDLIQTTVTNIKNKKQGNVVCMMSYEIRKIVKSQNDVYAIIYLRLQIISSIHKTLLV
jgi:hypothetical protein